MSTTTGTAAYSVLTTTSSTGGYPSVSESLASAGHIQANYERVVPWVAIRWNPDLRRHERWHNYYGCWRAADRYDMRNTGAVVRFVDTWAEPIDSNDDPSRPAVSPEAPHA